MPAQPIVLTAATSNGMTILNAAMQTCRDLGAKAMNGRR